jgi:hypothetical protein
MGKVMAQLRTRTSGARRHERGFAARENAPCCWRLNITARAASHPPEGGWMIPDSFIQELLYRVDLVDLIDGYVPLKKTGANFAACCPFHSEKSPSFTVSPSKQFYHCFGCGAHGNAIGFLMEYSGVGFM